MLKLLGKGGVPQQSTVFCKENDLQRTTIKALEKKGLVTFYKEQVELYQSTVGKGQSYELTPEQFGNFYKQKYSLIHGNQLHLGP